MGSSRVPGRSCAPALLVMIIKRGVTRSCHSLEEVLQVIKQNHHTNIKFIHPKVEKSCIWETKNLLIDADSRTNTILERLREAGIWSCGLRANERPRKKSHGKGTTHRHSIHLTIALLQLLHLLPLQRQPHQPVLHNHHQYLTTNITIPIIPLGRHHHFQHNHHQHPYYPNNNTLKYNNCKTIRLITLHNCFKVFFSY